VTGNEPRERTAERVLARSARRPMATEVFGIPTAPEGRSPTLTQRASLNAIASLLDYAAKLLVSFVVTPIVVAGLGPSLFGRGRC